MPSRFIDPETTTYNFSDSEDWIEVKNRLNLGEEQRLANIGLSGIRANVVDGNLVLDSDSAELSLDNEKAMIERFFIWITDWNFKDKRGKAVKLTRDAIKALDPDTGAEISVILDNHINKMQELKKTTIGRTATK